MLVFICLDLEDSVIVGNSINYLRTLRSWLSPVARSVNSAWKRCWHASVDGWAASTFHSRCDGKGPTVTIIRVGKYIFGGYTSVSWGKLLSLRQADPGVQMQSEVFRWWEASYAKETRTSIIKTIQPLDAQIERMFFHFSQILFQPHSAPYPLVSSPFPEFKDDSYHQ